MIKEIKDTVFEKYQVRKSKKTKTAFIEYVKGLCEERGIACTVEKKGISRNIVMGASPEESEIVMTAHYDTCAWMPLPNFITPKNMLAYILYQLFLTLMILAAAAAVSWIVSRFAGSLYGALALMVAVYGMLFLLIAGPANRHTANDNTSGTLTVLNTMLSMSEEQRAKVCFVLFDNEELGLFGSSAFKKMHRKEMKNKPLVNFDCVSDGDRLFAKLPSRERKSEFGIRFIEVMKNNAQQSGMVPVIGTTGFYPSDQIHFRRGVGVAALKKSWLVGLYMNRIHTHRDTVFEDRNIDCLTAAMKELVGADKAE